jgi:hypothetical protein
MDIYGRLKIEEKTCTLALKKKGILSKEVTKRLGRSRSSFYHLHPSEK